jgi:hypothetical protein
MKLVALLRTAAVVVLGYVAAFLGLRWVLAWTKGAPGEYAAKVAMYYLTAIVVLALAIAAKSVLEHATNGSGIFGAVRTIFTSAKPGDPPASAAAPAPPAPPAGGQS